MCFIPETKDDKSKVAQEDIVCYKFGKVRPRGFSPIHWQHYVYKRFENQQYVPLVITTGYASPEIYKGYHSCKDAIHCERHHGGGKGSVHIFVIPKGTEYYENYFEYVSSNIKWMGRNNWLTRLVMKLRRKLYGTY